MPTPQPTAPVPSSLPGGDKKVDPPVSAVADCKQQLPSFHLAGLGGGDIWRTGDTTTRSSNSNNNNSNTSPSSLLGTHLHRRSRSELSISPYSSLQRLIGDETSDSNAVAESDSPDQQPLFRRGRELTSSSSSSSSTRAAVIGPSKSFGAYTYSATTVEADSTGKTPKTSSKTSWLDGAKSLLTSNTIAIATSTASRSTSANTMNTDKIMTPRSPAADEEFAPDTSTSTSGLPSLPDDMDHTHLSLGDGVDVSHISAANPGEHSVVVIPGGGGTPVSRNLNNVFEDCDDVGDDNNDNNDDPSPPAASDNAGSGPKIAIHTTPSPAGLKNSTDGISPTGVDQLTIDGLSLEAKSSPEPYQTPRAAELQQAETIVATSSSSKIDIVGETVPFSLHSLLAQDLSAPTISRVSFYSVIHDINKEASGMASNDPAGDGASVGSGVGTAKEAEVATAAVPSGPGRPRSASDVTSSATTASHHAAAASSSSRLRRYPSDLSEISVATSGAGSTASKDEEFSPLVIAVNGPPPGLPIVQTVSKISTATTAASTAGSTTSVCASISSLAAASAVIDEERWLLRAVAARSEDEVDNLGLLSCPPTFAHAIGEQDSLAPDEGSIGSQISASSSAVGDITQARTQLWKPSRSWWEAKSGKNPWIEPASHNKRWRYLWPLIHYHKFLAKCIKKLKRNGVDVKTSVSPVAAFLRTEVCAISDHLARCSFFSSDEWMGCLALFEGWTDESPEGQEALRCLIRKQDLRALGDPADIESPLLRDQIDARFLKAMVAARSKPAEASAAAPAPSGGASVRSRSRSRSSPVEGRPPKAPGGSVSASVPGLPRPGGRPPVSIAARKQQKQSQHPSSAKKNHRGKRGRRRGSSYDGLDNSMDSRASSMTPTSIGTGEEQAWNAPPSPHHPDPYGEHAMMNGGYGSMPPPAYGAPYGMYGHNPYYPHPQQGVPMDYGFYGPPGQYPGAPPYGHAPYPGHSPYPMQYDPNMSMDQSMMAPPPPQHPAVPGTPDQSLDFGHDMSMASPAWNHLDRLANNVIATPSTNRTARAKQASQNPAHRAEIAGAARSLVFAQPASDHNGVPASPATMFKQSMTPCGKQEPRETKEGSRAPTPDVESASQASGESS